MSSRVILVIVLLLLGYQVLGCAQVPPSMPAVPQVIEGTAYLSPDEVIAIVQVYGVPYMRHYSNGDFNYSAHSVGAWAAVYETDGRWRVQGTIVVRRGDKDYYLSNTWIYDGEKLELVHFEKPPTLPRRLRKFRTNQ